MFKNSYDQVICKNASEMSYVLETARFFGKKTGDFYNNWNVFPVNLFLDGGHVAWNESQDRVGKKIGFDEFVKWASIRAKGYQSVKLSGGGKHDW